MPVALSYPGVYVEELPSSVRTITGVATSITAFVGRALRGPTDRPVRIQSFADFARTYGGLWVDSTLGYAVQQFFINGGSDALIARVHLGATAAALLLNAGFTLTAASEGLWGNALAARVDYATRDPGDANLFNLFVKDTGSGTLETFRNVSIAADDPRFVIHVLEQQSQLVRVTTVPPLTRPAVSAAAAAGVDPFTSAGNAYVVTTNGGDGSAITDNEVATGATLEANKQGIWMLEKADLFNLLCLPPPTRDTDYIKATWDAAIKYAHDRRAFVIVDAPAAWTNPEHHPGQRRDERGDAQRQRRDLFSARAAVRSSEREPPRQFRSFRHRRRNLCAHRCAARRVEGARRHRSGDGRRLRLGIERQPAQLTDGENGAAQSARGSIACATSRWQATWSGARARWPAPTRWRRSGSTFRCAGWRCTSRRACSAARSGWCSSPTTSRCGRRSA